VYALTARRAAGVLASDIDVFAKLGYRQLDRRGTHEATMRAPSGRPDIVVRLRRQGRVFGGNWALEVSTLDPVLPPSRGVAGRGRGIVRMRGVSFRGAGELAGALSADTGLGEALARVHFERVFVEPEGRPVIRHMGGSLVWVLFPPIVRATPLPAAQAREMVRALEAFAAVRADRGELGTRPRTRRTRTPRRRV
jgi:hypothetical protein